MPPIDSLFSGAEMVLDWQRGQPDLRRFRQGRQGAKEQCCRWDRETSLSHGPPEYPSVAHIRDTSIAKRDSCRVIRDGALARPMIALRNGFIVRATLPDPANGGLKLFIQAESIALVQDHVTRTALGIIRVDNRDQTAGLQGDFILQVSGPQARKTSSGAGKAAKDLLHLIACDAGLLARGDIVQRAGAAADLWRPGPRTSYLWRSSGHVVCCRIIPSTRTYQASENGSTGNIQ